MHLPQQITGIRGGPKVASRELREWLGITLADLFVYLALAAVAAMFFVSNRSADVCLAALGVALGVVGCVLGMKRDPEVSDFTNGVKLISYPACVLLIVGAIAYHYIRFNR
jgi:hypothetical protein